MTLTGEGGYEGLSAMVVSEYVNGTQELEGSVFEGTLPPMPDPVDPGSPGCAE